MNPFMQVTPGITEPELTELPLGTEAELTPGPNDVNPFRSEQERREVEEIITAQRERERRQGRTADRAGIDEPRETPPLEDVILGINEPADLPRLF